MPELKIVDMNNKKVGTVKVSPEVFDVKIRESLVQKYVNLQLAEKRGGNAATKQTMGEIRGGGAKPWRQKGTGRARVGSSRSALWRGGLTTFGPSPRDYGFGMSKKSKKLALKSVLTDRVQNDVLSIVKKLEIDEPKTKKAISLLKKLKLPDKTLFILSEKNPNLELAVRNLPKVDILAVDGLNAVSLLSYEKIVCTPESIKKIEERLN